jgi:hypothetical protein
MATALLTIGLAVFALVFLFSKRSRNRTDK